jgi:hypothetical protein
MTKGATVMQERTKSVGDKGDRTPRAAPKRRYAAPRLKTHGSVETVTRQGRGRARGHDKPKHTQHPPQHP